MLHLPCFPWNLWVKSAECTENDPFIKFLFSLYDWLTHHCSHQGHIAQKVCPAWESKVAPGGKTRTQFLFESASCPIWCLRAVWAGNFPSQFVFFAACTAWVLWQQGRCPACPQVPLSATIDGCEGMGGGKGCSDNVDLSAVCLSAC